MNELSFVGLFPDAFGVPTPRFIRNHGDPRQWRKHFGARKARGPKPGWPRGARLKENALISLVKGRLGDPCCKTVDPFTLAF